MEEKKFQSINDFLTKQGKRILFALYDKKSICSSELADFLNISRNSMSNALDRLKRAPYSLVSVKKQGRQNVYALKELGRAYVEMVLKEDENARELWEGLVAKEDVQEGIDAEQVYIKALECLKELDEADGNWSDKIDGSIVLNWDGNSEISSKFDDFLSLLQELKEHDENKRYHAVFEKVQDEKVRKYIDEIVNRRHGLGKLWEILADKWEDGYKIINTLFDIDDFLLEANAIKALYHIIAQNDLWQLIQSMQELISWASEKGYTQDEFQRLLRKEGAPDREYVWYLGVKYKDLCK